MNSDDYPSPARDQNSLSPSPIPKEALRPEQNETNLITKLRQRLNTANKHRQDLHHGDISKVDLSYLSPQSQVRLQEYELPLKTYKPFRNKFYEQSK